MEESSFHFTRDGGENKEGGRGWRWDTGTSRSYVGAARVQRSSRGMREGDLEQRTQGRREFWPIFLLLPQTYIRDIAGMYMWAGMVGAAPAKSKTSLIISRFT